MVKEPAGKWVVPNPQTPRSFGLMNIIFGILLVIAAILYGLFYAFSPAIQRFSQLPLQKQMEAAKAERAARIADLKQKEAAAKTDGRKATTGRSTSRAGITTRAGSLGARGIADL